MVSFNQELIEEINLLRVQSEKIEHYKENFLGNRLIVPNSDSSSQITIHTKEDRNGYSQESRYHTRQRKLITFRVMKN